MPISIHGRSKINGRIECPSSNCSFSKMLGPDDLSVTEFSLGIRINFTFSSVFWKRPIWVCIVRSKAWMAWKNSWVYESYYNVFSSPIKATPCWPNPSWKPQKLWGVRCKSPHLPISLNRFHISGTPQGFCLLIYWNNVRI